MRLELSLGCRSFHQGTGHVVQTGVLQVLAPIGILVAESAAYQEQVCEGNDCDQLHVPAYGVVEGDTMCVGQYFLVVDGVAELARKAEKVEDACMRV